MHEKTSQGMGGGQVDGWGDGWMSGGWVGVDATWTEMDGPRAGSHLA